jgi:hypothetical protein
VQAVLYEGLPASFRASWHAEAARALARAGVPVERVAQQVLGAADDQLGGRSSWLVDWLEEAGPALVDRAPSVAVPLLLRALDQIRPGGACRERLTRWLASAQLRLPEPARASHRGLDPPAAVRGLEATA